MLKKIHFENQEFHFSKQNLPVLIHGEEGSGASLFTMTMLADFYIQGKNIIGLTGFPMAREEFERQTGSNKNAQFLQRKTVMNLLNISKIFPT